MAQESPITSLQLFKEVRVAIRPEISDSVIEFRPPSSSGLTFTRASLPKRSIPKTPPTLKTEEDFTRRSFATESNIFFGRSGNYPRSFLWRILSDGCVLQIRSVDLSKGNEREEEASHVLEFAFTSSIRRGGVALAESRDGDILDVFVLGASNELYTLMLRKTFFCSAKASEGDLTEWCKVFKPGSLNFTTPHRLLAKSSLELILSLSDGRLVRLTRKGGEDGSTWHDVIYNDGKWGSSLRSLVRWQGANSLTFDGTTLEKNTPQALALCPDGRHLWVVCLDHVLKVWNMEQGRTVYRGDLLGVEREPHETAKLLLDPSNPNLVQIFRAETGLEGDRYYVLTYSPHELGQFKIWAVRDADAGNKGIRDLYPENIFRVPDPDPSPDSKAIWKMVDFKTHATEETLDIWLLMRSNRQYKLYSLEVPLTDFGRSLSSHWMDHWTTTAFETLESFSTPQTSDAEAEGVMESWIEFLFSRADLPEDIIELALRNYETAQKLNVSKSPKASLQERLQTAVLSSVQLQRLEPEGMDFSGYRSSLEQEWTLIWEEIWNLKNSIWEILSLAYDDGVQAPWLAFRGGCSLIRKCSKTEIVAHNDVDVLKMSQSLLERPSMEVDGGAPILPDELSILLQTAADFRKGLGHDLINTCNSVLATELWQDPGYSVPLRIQSFYDRCHFDTDLNDDDVIHLKTKLQSVTNAHFEALLEYLPATRSREQGLLSTEFGLGMIVRGAQELINLQEQMLFNMLLLIIIIEVEMDETDFKMQGLDAAPLYIELLHLLKQYQVMQWLAHNIRLEPRQTSSNENGGKSSKDPSSAKSSTILQNLFARALNPRPLDGQSQLDTLTLDIEDVLVWTTGIDEEDVAFDDALAHIQCNLLANNNIDLAISFLRYQPSNSWATYLKGRLHLLTGSFAEAAIYFKKAAFKLCKPPSIPHQESIS